MEPSPAAPDERPGTLLENLLWGVVRGVAIACLPLAIRTFQSAGLLARARGTPPIEGNAMGLEVLLLGAGLGGLVGVMRPLMRYLWGSVLIGIVSTEALFVSLRLWAGRTDHAIDRQLVGAAGVLGIVLGV